MSKQTDFKKLHDAVEEFKSEVFKALHIPELVEWLRKRLRND